MVVAIVTPLANMNREHVYPESGESDQLEDQEVTKPDLVFHKKSAPSAVAVGKHPFFVICYKMAHCDRNGPPFVGVSLKALAFEGDVLIELVGVGV